MAGLEMRAIANDHSLAEGQTVALSNAACAHPCNRIITRPRSEWRLTPERPFAASQHGTARPPVTMLPADRALGLAKGLPTGRV